MSLMVSVDVNNTEPCLGTGHSLSLICQPTNEDMKLYIIINSLRSESRRDQEDEVSWTLMKKSESFAGPGEIKRRAVMLDPQVSPEEIKSREVELGSESWASFASVISQQQCYLYSLCDSVPHSS